MGTPKYVAIKNDIKEKIKSGFFSPGEKVYSENEIKTIYGVSSTTAVKAIQELVNEGYLTRQQGIGTFVRKAFMDKEVFVNEYAVPPCGKEKNEESVKVIFVKEIENKGIARKLNIDESAKIIHFLRVRYMNGKPWNIQNTFIAKENLPNIELNDFNKFESLSHAIKSLTGIDTLDENMEEKISIVFPIPAEVKELLEAEETIPAFYLERITYHPEKVPFEYIETYIHYQYYSLGIIKQKK